MRVLSPVRIRRTARPLLGSLAIILALTLLSATFGPTRQTTHAQETQAAPQAPQTVFSNPSPISVADRPSNNAGTNPGLASIYPSTIVVSGLGNSLSKVTVTFAITTTFPDDFDILLIGPTGARSLIMSDAGGSAATTNITYTFDQTVATAFPDTATTATPAGTYRPANYTGLATPEPGGQDNFPTPGPGLTSYTADLNIFNGTNPNGTWSLYVVDDQFLDTMSLPSGWSLDITAITPGGGKTVDFDGDGKTDPAVVRNIGGGPGGQIAWFIRNSQTGSQTSQPFGINGDRYVPEDYDGDGKTDIAVWRSGSPFNAYFYILQSTTNTLRSDQFGQTGDDPSVVGDYDGDGKADVATFRNGTNPGDHSFWFYRSSVNGLIIYNEWGQNGDFPAPGDYDGDGRNDFVVQRNAGGGQAGFHIKLATGTTSGVIFGTPSDNICPGDYDGDGKTDIAVVRSSGGQHQWYIRKSSDGATLSYTFGLSATDFLTQGDWDGDGITDLGIWRPDANPSQTFFFWRRSIDGTLGNAGWGQNGDYPVANYNRH
jgi:FG-GAP repeat.